jgi:Methyltransferase domain
MADPVVPPDAAQRPLGPTSFLSGPLRNAVRQANLPASKPASHHHLDVCAVYRGSIVVEGWAEAGPPVIVYQGQPLRTVTHPVARSDVIERFGEAAAQWGFRAAAASPFVMLEHNDIALRFPNGELLKEPGRIFQSPENAHFNGLAAQFLAASEPGHRVLEIGSRARSGNTYRHLVHPDAQYVGMDIAAGPNVDVVGDAHHLSRHVDGPFDAVFSVSVWEHLLMPWMVSLEMNRVMKQGALAYIQSHAAYPLHEQPWDFWRFSKDAWRGLFNAHTGFEVVDSGHALRCLIVSDFAFGAPIQQGDLSPSYLLSGCLVRKIGPAQVRWDAEAAAVYNLGYDHA